MGGVWDKLSEKKFRLRRAFGWIFIVTGCVPSCKIAIFLYLVVFHHVKLIQLSLFFPFRTVAELH